MNPDIATVIPHRPPFLLVDEIVSVEGNTIHTRRRFPAEDPVFKGHFPEFPLVPGVLICEAIFQSGAILISRLAAEGFSGRVPALTRIGGAKFKRAVRPGETIEMEVSLKEHLANAWFMQGTARVEGKTAVSVEFACAAVDKEAME
jgi:3-hydroxyacyl-[acyl-carrier-protein] dehydratase